MKLSSFYNDFNPPMSAEAYIGAEYPDLYTLPIANSTIRISYHPVSGRKDESLSWQDYCSRFRGLKAVNFGRHTPDDAPANTGVSESEESSGKSDKKLCSV